MKSINYWKLREIKAREHLLDTSIAQSEKQLKKMYRELAKDILTQVENAVLKMQEGKSISHTFNYQKYYELLEVIQKKLKTLGDNETKLISKDMTSLYKQTGTIVDKTNNLKFSSSQINDSRIKQIINSEWVGDGKNWSQRIWTHQGELSQKLSKGILDAMEAGIPLSNLKKELMNDFNVGYHQASRIVRTEYVHIANKAATDRYEQAGIKKYRVLCNQDERLCPECQQMDGQEFFVDDATLLPPFHCNCRCTTIAVIDTETQED